ncbi:MAG: hypothetical protein E7441_06635 [Ruminococcaceae bacterium]|nr:hypothetical protein [Oscillospiraceae bacterium]
MKRQIKTKLARILCIALSLCMMLALIPAAFAETTEETKDFKIDFLNGGVDPGIDNINPGEKIWAFKEKTISGSIEHNKNVGLNIKSKKDGTDVGKYVAYEFEAPASGTFDITYVHAQVASGTIPSGGKGDVYILDGIADIKTAITGTEGLMFDEVIYYASENNNSYEEPEKAEITLTAEKKYLLVFVVTGAGEGSVESTQYRQYPSSLTFTPQAEPGITINYNIKDIITAKPEVNYVNGGSNAPVAFKDVFNYETTKGFFDFVTAYKEFTNDTTRLCCYSNFIQFGDTKDRHIVFELNVPARGVYSIKVDTKEGAVAPVEVFLSQSTTDYTNEDFLIGTYNGIADSASTADLLDKEGTVWEKELEAGKYNIAFVGKKDSSGNIGSLGNLYLYTGGGKGEDSAYMGPVLKADKTVLNIGNTANLEVIACMSDGNSADVDIEWASNNENVAKVKDGVVTAVGSGVADISAIVTYNGVPEPLTKVITVNDSELTSAFSDVDASGSVPVGEKASINILTYSTDGTPQTYEATIEAEYNEPTSITAPAAPDGYTFLYWAKGAMDSKQIIPGETCTIYPTVETTYMIAVYAPTGAAAEDKVEFYNYNGQLLTDARIDGGKMPELPYMTGYGKAKHWVHYGTDKTYEAEADASAFATGTHIFVAQYDDLQENITVTAENCIVNDGSSATVKYGDTVECVADGEGTFKWWTKTVNGKTEIVSLDKDYTFKAWETCTVTAVYGDKAPTYVGDTMRIILGTLNVGDETAYMAEFVGLDSAIEKGIMLGTKKIAMSSKDNQFTIINDEGVEAANIKGYAILANGTLITDN